VTILYYGRPLAECDDDLLRKAVVRRATSKDVPLDLARDVAFARALRAECEKRGIPHDEIYYEASHREELEAIEAELEELP
jgi:hypothetical protein